MNTIPLKLEKIYELAYEVLTKHGCDHLNAYCVATTVTHAERDGSVSHGLFRIPGYVASLKSKKVNAVSRPTNNYLTQNAIRVDGDYGFAPVGIKVGLPELIICLVKSIVTFIDSSARRLPTVYAGSLLFIRAFCSG